jgi:hypothetical protein
MRAHEEWTKGLANGSATWIMIAIFAGKFYLLFSFYLVIALVT